MQDLQNKTNKIRDSNERENYVITKFHAYREGKDGINS